MNKIELTDELIAYAIDHLNCPKKYLETLTESQYNILITSYNKFLQREEDMYKKGKEYWDRIDRHKREMEEEAINAEEMYKNVPFIREI